MINKEYNMNLVTEDKVVLKSVGCVFDTKQGITYPIMMDDTIDWDGGVDVMVTDCEWFRALSPKDFTIVEKYFTDEELDIRAMMDNNYLETYCEENPDFVDGFDNWDTF